MLISDLLDGLAERLRTIDEFDDVTTDPLVTATPPMALVEDADVEYNATMGRGSDDVNVVVTVFVSKVDSAQGVLDARLYKSGHGSMSVRSALETSTGATDPLTVADVMIRVDSATTTTSERGDGSFIAVSVSLLATVDGTT